MDTFNQAQQGDIHTEMEAHAFRLARTGRYLTVSSLKIGLGKDFPGAAEALVNEMIKSLAHRLWRSSQTE